MSTPFNTWVASLTSATIDGAESLAVVDAGVTKKVDIDAITTFVLTTGITDATDGTALATTDKFPVVRSGAVKSITGTELATFATAQLWAGATLVTSEVTGDLVMMYRTGTGTVTITWENLISATVTAAQAAAANLSTLATAITAFTATDTLLVCQSTTGTRITAANFETQLWSDFAAYVHATLPEASSTAATDKIYCTAGGTPKYVNPDTMAAYMFKTGMGTTAETLQTVSAKETPIAADSLLVVDSADTSKPKLTTLEHLDENYLTTRNQSISASQTSGQENATALTKKINIITGSTGAGYAKLPNPTTTLVVTVVNATAQTITLYGYANETVNGTAGATGVSLLTETSVTLYSNGTNWFA